MSGSGIVVGVDVGGTFTDLCLLDSAARTFRIAKVASHRGDEASGFLNGLAALEAKGIDSALVHGTTVGTNALLERRGPKTGIITTRGFRDVIEMRRRDRRRVWGLWGDFVPIVERDMRLEVPSERSLTERFANTSIPPKSGSRRSCCSTEGRKASPFSSSTHMPIRRTSAARSRRFGPCGRTIM